MQAPDSPSSDSAPAGPAATGSAADGSVSAGAAAGSSNEASSNEGPSNDGGAGPGEAGRVPELDADVRALLPALDPGALQQFFDRYFDRIYGYVRRLVRSDHLAEDLTQDVFLHVHRSLPNYDPARPLAPWVFTIAANKVRDHWRSRRAQEERRVVSIDDDTAPLLADEGGGPTGELSAGEQTDAISRAVADLPEMLQQTFVLRYYQELSFAEIGRIVDRNETAVRKRYSRALAELRAALTEENG